MKTLYAERGGRESGSALVYVLVVLALALMILGGTMNWCATNNRMVERNNHYMAAMAAAEAATEKVISEMSRDYQREGAALVSSKLSTYRARVPEVNESAAWARYRFSNGAGGDNLTWVEQTVPWGVSSLISQYQGLSGYASTFRVVANARPLDSRHAVVGAIQQTFQIATIPIFQFAIFYNIDLEVNPGANMTINGRVHSNRDTYTRPGATLRYNGDVTSAGNIYHERHPLDPTSWANGAIVYGGEHDSGVNTLNLPIGVDNTPENVRQIVEMPPVGESPSSAMGRQRMYNQADLIIKVYDTTVEATGPVGLGNSPNLGWSGVSSFVRTNVTFFNKREGKTVKTTEIDVAALRTWNNSGNTLRTALGRDVKSIYVADLRSQTSSTQPGIRMVNGQELPPAGLTVATPDPLYVKGHYNVPSSAIGTANTANTKPAAFIADAVTVLSTAWNDANSGSSLSSRPASSTTVNAAFLAGIVETTTSSYSGGVENFPRFLEDWSGDTFTYNGSMIVMFPSQIATARWRGTGGTIGIYNPPTRNWSFDLNFLQPDRLPPCTPEVRAAIRGEWTAVAPNSTQAGG